MIPGLTSDAEAQIGPCLQPDVTALSAGVYAALDYTLFEGGDAGLLALGVTVTEGAPLVVVTDPARPVGSVRIACGGPDTLLFIDNRAGSLNAVIRVLGRGCTLLFNGDADVTLPTLFLRSDRQFVFWGTGASAVDCSVEIEGAGQGLIVGDDALIANGVWIRNHDMHALHDLDSGRRLSRNPVTTIMERHVWLGQDSLLLGCSRIGAGSVVGARALVKGALPACAVAVGTPARVIRTGVSWGRDLHGMSDSEHCALKPRPSD